MRTSRDDISKSLEYIYANQVGPACPKIIENIEQTREEQMREGWTYYTLGQAYLDLNNAAASERFQKHLILPVRLMTRKGSPEHWTCWEKLLPKCTI